MCAGTKIYPNVCKKYALINLMFFFFTVKTAVGLFLAAVKMIWFLDLFFYF
jgi:hypothetical protein